MAVPPPGFLQAEAVVGAARKNDGVPTYVRWYWPDDDIWNYDELDDERWSLRHIEVRGRDGLIIAAASLADVLAARDSGGIAAVQKYESRYGMSPEAPFPEQPDEYPIEPIAQAVFDDLWRCGRQGLGDGVD
jgi:hypothetical protein